MPAGPPPPPPGAGIGEGFGTGAGAIGAGGTLGVSENGTLVGTPTAGGEVPPGVLVAASPLLNGDVIGGGGRCAFPVGGANAPAIPHGPVDHCDNADDDEEVGTAGNVGVVAAI